MYSFGDSKEFKVKQSGRNRMGFKVDRGTLHKRCRTVIKKRVIGNGGK